MEKNPEIIQKFTNALQKGMEYVQSHTPEEIAEVIAPQFAETDLDTVTAIVKRYYDQDTWKSNLITVLCGNRLNCWNTIPIF